MPDGLDLAVTPPEDSNPPSAPGGRGRRSFLTGLGAAVAGGFLASIGDAMGRTFGPDRRSWPAAGASPASGFSRSGLGRGVVTRGASIGVREATDVVVDAVTIEPGGQTGWHTHPGPEVLVVTRGVLTFRRSDGKTCLTEQVRAGQAFVGAAAGELHAAHNEGAEDTEFVVTFFDVPPGDPPRQDADPPSGCP
ncbi:MAG: cupin domain-containing protein [Actinomycetota bacterium]